MAEFKPVAEVRKNIKLVGSNAVKLDDLIHLTALQCIMHARPHAPEGVEFDPKVHGHGDVTLFQELYNALRGRSVYRQALISWAAAFTPIRVNQSKSTKGGLTVFGLAKESVNKDYVPFNLEGAEKLPFYAMSDAKDINEPKIVGFAEVLKGYEQLRKRIAKAVNDELWAGTPEDAQKLLARIDRDAKALSDDFTTSTTANKNEPEAPVEHTPAEIRDAA